MFKIKIKKKHQSNQIALNLYITSSPIIYI